MSKLSDILIGSAHVPAHVEGGWALPGGGRTTDPEVAIAVAGNISRLIGPKAPLKSLNQPIVLASRSRRRRSVLA